MRTGRPLAIGTTVLAALLVGGCATGTIGDNPPGVSDSCVPRMTVSPTTATAGGSITLMSQDVCDVAVPADGWQVGVGSTGDSTSLVTIRTTESFDGSFEVTLTLPADFPSGTAYVGVDNGNDSRCGDTGSCAAATGSFEVTR